MGRAGRAAGGAGRVGGRVRGERLPGQGATTTRRPRRDGPGGRAPGPARPDEHRARRGCSGRVRPAPRRPGRRGGGRRPGPRHGGGSDLVLCPLVRARVGAEPGREGTQVRRRGHAVTAARSLSGLRTLRAPFVAPGPSGVAIRTRLHLRPGEVDVLRAVGGHLGRLAAGDLAQRWRDGLAHDKGTWAERKRALTAGSSSRWAGSITKANHDQWALAHRGQAAHIDSLDAGIATIRHRLWVPVGEPGAKGTPGGTSPGRSGSPRRDAWPRWRRAVQRSLPTGTPGSCTSCVVAAAWRTPGTTSLRLV